MRRKMSQGIALWGALAGLVLAGCAEDKKQPPGDDRAGFFREASLSTDVRSTTDANRPHPDKNCLQAVTLNSGEKVIEITRERCPADRNRLARREAIVARLKIPAAPVAAPVAGYPLTVGSKAVGLAHDRETRVFTAVVSRYYELSRLCQFGPAAAPRYQTACRLHVTNGVITRLEVLP